jgi:sugar phosphate isomerase/epimerase
MNRPFQLLCSTGTFTRHPDQPSHRAILRYGPLLPADGLELLIYPSWHAQTVLVAQELAATGLRFPVAHAEKGIGAALGSAEADKLTQGLQRLAANCRLAADVGAGLVVLHLWDLPDSDEHLARNLAALEDCLELATRAGVELAVETVPCRRADPLGNVRRVLERYPRCWVTLDTEFLAFHDQLEAALDADWLWESGRVCHVHVKDYDGCMWAEGGSRRYLHPGEGHIDFAHFFSALRRRGFDGAASLEASGMRGGDIDVKWLVDSLNTLRELASFDTIEPSG